MVHVREATPADATAITRLFEEVYGSNYLFPDYYNPDAVLRMIHDDEQIILVADHDGKVAGTASMLLAVGDHDDLLALLGRFVVSPSVQGNGIGRALAEARAKRVRELVHFAYGEVRTPHARNQKLYESLGFAPVGWQPECHGHHECHLLYAQLYSDALALRRGSPRIISEVAVLADTALDWMGAPRDAVVDDDTIGWSTAALGLAFERLDAGAYPRLMRIARGRAVNRVVFGNLTLSRGLRLLSRAQSDYLVARDGQTVVGGIGWTWDEADRRLRIFELIGITDEVKGALLAEVDRIGHSDLPAEYIDIDVSAHAPALQRTLERLGFAPVGYLPAMVFEAVERIDVVRMVKLRVPYDAGKVELVPRAAKIRSIVERALDDRLVASVSFEGLRELSLFAGLGDGERHELARLATIEEAHAGTQIITAGAPTDAILVLLEGEARIERDALNIGVVRRGEVFGEIGLVQESRRTATVTASTPVKMLRLDVERLRRRFEARPRIGQVVMRNLAHAIAEKLLDRSI
jgi:ribosomal protein S18 acetylase RimI-like enzyme